MGITRLVLRFAAPAPDIEKFDRFLFVGPHPDDIEIGAGATAAKLAAAGKSVSFLICTDGRYGSTNLETPVSADELAARRRAEALTSAETLGIRDVHFLELCDGGFYSTDELETSIAKVIGELKPQVIFAPDPCVTSECHADHLNVGNAARKLAEFAPFPDIMLRFGAEPAPVEAIAFYMTAKPNRFINTAGFMMLQDSAIFDCHLSQFPSGSPDSASLKLYLKLRSVDLGLRCLCRSAEGFRVLGKTNMHCLPESGN